MIYAVVNSGGYVLIEFHTQAHALSHTHTHTVTHTKNELWISINTHTHIGRRRQRERQRGKDRYRDLPDRHRQTDRQTDKHTHTQSTMLSESPRNPTKSTCCYYTPPAPLTYIHHTYIIHNCYTIHSKTLNSDLA